MASVPDGTLNTSTATTSVEMTSPLENLYPNIDTSEPVFAQSGPVFAAEQVSDSLPVSASGHAPETGDSYRAISEDQSYWETVRGVRAFMGWNHIPDLEYSPASRTDNPWVSHRAQPVGKVSVLLPTEDWLCRKLENLTKSKLGF